MVNRGKGVGNGTIITLFIDKWAGIETGTSVMERDKGAERELGLPDGGKNVSLRMETDAVNLHNIRGIEKL